MRGVIDSPARRARLTSWIDTMLSPPRSKKLSSMPTRSTPSTSANSAHRIASCGVRGARCECGEPKLRLRQRPAVELAVWRQRQPLQHHQRGRHHVVRQLPRQRGPQRRGVQHRARCRHHIADQPLAAAHHPAARSRRPATRPPARSAPPRSRPARSGTRAASPARRRGPGTPAPRPTATAPGPRSGTSGCRPRRSGRRQTAPPSATPGSDSPAPDQRPRCTARPTTPAGTGSRPPSRT